MLHRLVTNASSKFRWRVKIPPSPGFLGEKSFLLEGEIIPEGEQFYGSTVKYAPGIWPVVSVAARLRYNPGAYAGWEITGEKIQFRFFFFSP